MSAGTRYGGAKSLSMSVVRERLRHPDASQHFSQRTVRELISCSHQLP
jgi:hypothetical protein